MFHIIEMMKRMLKPGKSWRSNGNLLSFDLHCNCFVLLYFGVFLTHLEEYDEAGDPEASQEGVVDHVEDGDLYPREGGSTRFNFSQ